MLDFLGIEGEYEGFFCWPNNKINQLYLVQLIVLSFHEINMFFFFL